MSVDASREDGRGRSGFVHEAALYGSDEEFLAVAVPFLRAGLAAGQPTVLSINARQEGLLREALGEDGTGLRSLTGQQRYAHPTSALRLNYELFNRHAQAGAERIYMIGEVPHTGAGASWDSWARYEAVVNHFYAALPVWSICPYDLRSTAEYVLTDVQRTHTHFATPDGRHPANPRYVEPEVFLAERARTEIDPLEKTLPHLELIEPSLAAARQATAALARTTALHIEAVGGLVLAVNETLANARAHGQPPVELRGWAAADRVVVAVRDHGPGPADPFAGFLPDQRDLRSGRGLWIASQLCDRVSLSPSPEHFTVRLLAGVFSL